MNTSPMARIAFANAARASGATSGAMRDRGDLLPLRAGFATSGSRCPAVPSRRMRNGSAAAHPCPALRPRICFEPLGDELVLRARNPACAAAPRRGPSVRGPERCREAPARAWIRGRRPARFVAARRIDPVARPAPRRGHVRQRISARPRSDREARPAHRAALQLACLHGDPAARVDRNCCGHWPPFSPW